MPQRITKVLGLIALTGLSSLVSAQTTLDWKPAGPVYNAGRARNMIVDQNDSKTLYVGSASSGIFKSKNGGVKWYAINDQATVRNISYMAQAADGTIYVGTGEGFLRPGQKLKAQPGTGLYRLNFSDSTLVSVPSASSSIVGTVINRVACSPISVNNIALATSKGIFVSTNGGGLFSLVSLPGVVTGSAVAGQDVKFDSNGILCCSIGSEQGASNPASQIYRSTDASLTSFTNITPISTILPDMNYGRIELGIAPSNPNVIYASCANKYTNVSSATLKGLFVSYDAGVTWGLILQGSSQLDPLSNGGTLASGDYAQVILVNPTNPDQIFFGSYSFYVFTRTGGSNSNPIGAWQLLGESYLSNFQYYLHENIHDIKLIPGSPAKFYFVTDAGVYRSIDLLSASQIYPPSFQPFYKGMITGQFNSVSIERYPIGDSVSTSGGTNIKPYSGFIGGTGGNGLTYFSGLDTLVTTELNYIGGEVYNSEYSKILPNAAFASAGNGGLYRSTNVKTSTPTLLNVNKYSNILSKIAPDPNPFVNSNYTVSGTPFRLWENYGQANSPDSAVFYNDSVRYQASMTGIPDPVTGVRELITKTTFTFSTSRPNKYALIDSIVVRTGTVVLPISGSSATLSTPFNAPGDGQTIFAALPHNYTTSATTTTLSATPVGQSTIPVTFTLNAVTLLDNISVTFTAPPFASKTILQYPPNATGTAIVVPDAAAYYRVFATVFYRYKPGDIVNSIDNNISTKTNTYSATLTQPLSWNYGSFPSTTITSTSTLAVSNPTYVLVSSAALNTPVAQSGPTFTVTPYTTTTYTIQKYGTFTLSAKPVVYTVSIDPFSYTIAANTNTTASSVSYTLLPNSVQSGTDIIVFTVTPTGTGVTTYTILTPGSGTTTTSQNFTFAPTSFSINPSSSATVANVPNVYIVHPTVTTTYSITQTTGTLTQNTFSTVGTTTYVLNPGNIIKVDSTDFVVNTGTVPVTYTINGISSNTLAGVNTSITSVFPLITTSVVTFGAPPFSKNNKPVKMKTSISARIAMILNNSDNTGSANAIVVSKNPLALNDPLSVVRVSQTGAYSDDATGHPTNTLVTTIVGNPMFLEWSKSGTEIYFATDSNRLYRVSHITTVMDLSPASYSGKFYTDVFKYAAPINASNPNPLSPYRTTLIGRFDKPITSISVSSDSIHLAVTFNSPSTGTTATIIYNTNDSRKSNISNIGWVNAQGTLPGSVTVTYCSMMEKNDNKILFLGTDNGMYYTSDVTAGSPTWHNVNDNTTSKLPNVQVFDIKQQTFQPWECYNSGQIYVATNGRGIWTTGKYYSAYSVGIQEYQKPIEGHNLSIYPNPTNGNVNIAFNSIEGETATIHIMDISGRVMQSQDLGKLNAGEVNYSLSTSDLTSGVYIVNISSNSNVKRVTKLIVTK